MTTVYRKFTEEENLYEKIDTANKSLVTIDVKGKSYVQVHQRIKAFRYVFPRGKIETKIISLEGEVGKRTVLMRTEAYDDLGNLLATGYAEEKEDSTFINKTSFIENAETSATGRALGLCGFGIDTSIASAEEVETAIANQNKGTLKPTRNALWQLHVAYEDEELESIRKSYNVENDEDLPRDVVNKLVAKRKDKIKEEEKRMDEEIRETNLINKEYPFY